MKFIAVVMEMFRRLFESDGDVLEREVAEHRIIADLSQGKLYLDQITLMMKSGEPPEKVNQVIRSYNAFFGSTLGQISEI